MVQRAATDHVWLNKPRTDAIQFGQRPGPTARAAGHLATRLVAPRIVAATWWEHLLFLCAAWVCVVLAFCYVSGTALSITPGVLFAPFFPSVVVLVWRMTVTTTIDFKTQSSFLVALNAAHALFAPLGCALFFAKLWYAAGAIPWWLVFLFPFLALTRVIVDSVRDVVIAMPMTEFAALGYGPEGSAYEFAFSSAAPGDREIDTRSGARADAPFVAKRVFEARAADEERASAAASASAYASEDDAREGEPAPERRETRDGSRRAGGSPPGLAAYRPTPEAERATPAPVPPRARALLPPVTRSLPQPRQTGTAAPQVRSGGFGALPPAPPSGGVASPAGVSPRFPTRRSPAAFGAFAKR